MTKTDANPSTNPLALASTLTYQALLAQGAELLAKEGMTRQPIANLCSALRLWMRVHGFAPERLVHHDLGSDFDRLLLQFADAIAPKLSPRTQRDRQEQMVRWQRSATLLQRVDSLPLAFAEALRVSVAASGRPAREVARESGIPVTTFTNWLDGKVMPRGVTVAQIPALEATLGLPRATLLARLPATRRNRYERSGEAKSRASSFTERRRAQKRTTGNYWPAFEGRLAEQWAAVLDLKTDLHREHGTHHNSWRLKEPAAVATRIRPWMLHNGMVCATASVQWGMLAGYIGWMSLPKPSGLELAKDCANTLAWLADADRVIAHSRWLATRSGNRIHNGVAVFLQTVCSYLRPTTGFLWLNPQLRHNLRALGPQVCGWAQGIDTDEAWQAHCKEAARKLRSHLRRQLPPGQKPRCSRDPVERAAVVLNDEVPLRVLVQFLGRLKASPPPIAHERDYRAWLRDVVLSEMIVRNPLRAETYAAMTYRADGSGNLVRTGPNSYKLKFPPEAFKNQKGAACEEYEADVDPSVAPWINRYLAEARPNMPDAQDTDRFFLPAAKGPRTTKPHLEAAGIEEPVGYQGAGLSSRLKCLTATYIDGCPGFGSHAFRHIVATDHLCRHPGDYSAVALLLHDKLETVLKNYAHLKTRHGLRSLSRDIAALEQELSGQPASER